MLTKITAGLVRSYGRDGAPLPGEGRIELTPLSPGVWNGRLRGADVATMKIVDGTAEPAEVTPGPWRVTVRPEGAQAWRSWVIEVPEVGTIDLADLAPVVTVDGEALAKGDPGPPGASVVGGVDQGDGTIRFVLSDGTETDPVTLPPGPAGRGIDSISDPDAESRVTVTYTDGGTQQVQAIRGRDGRVPVIEWAGSALVVDGVAGPDLRGAPGAASTVPGPAGPPGQVLTPESMLVVGPGRPDAPTTTGMTSAALAALPVGCEYRSTNGASVGAWVWRKRPTGWTVTDGDTGWMDVSLLCFVHETGAYVTEPGRVYMRMTTEATEVRFGHFPPSIQSGQSLRVPPLKAWLPAWPFNSGRQLPVGMHEYFGDIALKAYAASWMSPEADSYWRIPRSTSWPTSLPGTPAT